MRNDSAGFTLLELLAALTILGFLVVGLSGSLRLGVSAFDRQRRAADVVGEFDATDRSLRRLIQQIDPGPASENSAFQGDPHSLRMATELPAAAGALTTQHAWALLRVDNARRMILRWTPRRHAASLAPAASPTDAVLLEGVDHLQLSYLSSDPFGWLNEWSGQDLPAAIRVHIVFQPGDARRWPDIIAIPMRDRPR